MRIFINPGHALGGRPDPGAVNCEHGVTEAAINARVAENARIALERCGYDGAAPLGALLEELARRIERQKTFPHEIGLFLGYPPGDVAGFIEHRGQRFALSGYWKVYGDEAEARALFARYAACTEEFCGKLMAGQRFEDLVVAV